MKLRHVLLAGAGLLVLTFVMAVGVSCAVLIGSMEDEPKVQKGTSTQVSSPVGLKAASAGRDDITSEKLVRVTVTNNTKNELSVNPLYFEAQDTAGNKYPPGLGGQLQTVDLAPGQSTTGTIGFQTNSNLKILIYNDDAVLGGEQARAEIKK